MVPLDQNLERGSLEDVMASSIGRRITEAETAPTQAANDAPNVCESRHVIRLIRRIRSSGFGRMGNRILIAKYASN